MKKLLVIFAGLMLAASFAAAAPACVQQSLDNYLVGGFSCQIGNLVFSNFHYSNPANPAVIAIPASGITVIPDTTPLDEGLAFNPGMSVSAPGSFQDALIVFTIATANGLATIDDLELGFNGSVTGSGSTGVIEQYCLGAATLKNCPKANSGQISVTNPPPVFNAPPVVFAPVSMLTVSKDINATAGSEGTAHLSHVFNNYSQIPEPMTLSLIGAGLFGLGLMKRRRA